MIRQTLHIARALLWSTAAVAAPAAAASTQRQPDPAPTAAQASPPLTAPPPDGTKLNTTGRDIDLIVPLRESGPIGQVGIRIRTDDNVLVSKTDLQNALRRGVTETFLQRIAILPDEGGFVPLSSLAGTGLTLSFDRNALELTARFAPEALPEQRVGLGFDTVSSAAEPDVSADFAAMLAYQANIDWVHRGFDPGMRKPRVNFEFNGRLFRTFAFENQFTYDGNLPRSFTRFASRAIYDIPSSMIRLSAGDLIPATTALQSQIDIGGLGISKLLDTFQSDRVFTASAGRKLTLREPATVTVIVNGATARTLRLDPGNYDIQDLPLTGGANRVELLIEDAAGGRRLVSFDFFEDISLLAPGIDEYDLKAGIRSDVDERGRYYFRREPVVTGFYRRGITDQLTLGANMQASKRAVQVGGEASLGTKFGLITLEATGSHLEDFGSGAAMRLQYRHSMPMKELSGSRRFDALVEYRTKNFGGIDGIPSNPYSVTASVRYYQPFTNRFSGGFGADYRKGRGGTEDFRAIRADANYRLDNGMNFTGSIGYDNRDGMVFGVSLFWRFGKSSLATARYDSRSDQASVGYFYSPQRPLDTLSWGVEGNHADGRFNLNGTAIYRTNRGDFELAHRETFGDDDVIREQVTSARARGTIAFADGKFAIGRYMNNSFAIISGHPSLKGAQVLLGSQVASEAEARTGALGPALVNLGSYAKRNLYYTVPDAPAGYDFGAGTIDLYPWLHAGLVRMVGSEFNVSILGTLRDDKGAPVPLAIGLARRLGDPKSPSIEIYTNRQGRLGASGLAPGTWQVEAGNFSYRFTITEEQGTLVDLQDLRPTLLEEQK